MKGRIHMYVRWTYRMSKGKYQRVYPERLSGKFPICNVLRYIGTYLQYEQNSIIFHGSLIQIEKETKKIDTIMC
jgi:hypothetical protein